MKPAGRDHKGNISGIGVVLVVIGIIWLLRNTGIISLRHFEWWPLILIGIGLIHMLNFKNFRTLPGWFFIITGSYFFVNENRLISDDLLHKFWPLILIFLGIIIITGRSEKGEKKESDDIDNTVYGTAFLSGFNRKLYSKAFKCGKVTAIFGGAEIDLREAVLGRNGADLEINAVFGGIELRIPEDWNIEISSSAIFGGIGNKSSNNSGSGNRILRIKAAAIFGGVEIKN